MVRWVTILAMSAAMAVLTGCKTPQLAAAAGDPMLSVDTLHPAPADFLETRIGTPPYRIPPYAKHLAGVRICLDPGHGGDADKRAFKRGPSGVREAEVNLRVAQYLRELLQRAGAEVLLTREGDTDLSLEERAGVANAWPADLFISLHHNAIGGKPQVNHTTVWYHGGVDERPSNLDLARYLSAGLHDYLGLDQATDVPLKSDQLMYPGGFGVLRHAQVTAALTESSFFTNPEEEQRLRTPEHNLNEAYGLFIGLAQYAAGGFPRARMVEPADGVVRPSASLAGGARENEDGALEAGPEALAGFVLTFELDDGLRGRKSWGAERQMILSSTIAVRIDGEAAPHDFDAATYRLLVGTPPDLGPGEHHVSLQFQNMYKNSVLNPTFAITVAPESVGGAAVQDLP